MSLWTRWWGLWGLLIRRLDMGYHGRPARVVLRGCWVTRRPVASAIRRIVMRLMVSVVMMRICCTPHHISHLLLSSCSSIHTRLLVSHSHCHHWRWRGLSLIRVLMHHHWCGSWAWVACGWWGWRGGSTLARKCMHLLR